MLSVNEPEVFKLEENHIEHGFHFLSHESLKQKTAQEYINEIMDNFPKTRSDLLDYLVQPDKTVVCKWCGEWLPSRTHWYRHKYKLHMPNTGLPAGLIKCAKCNTFFKSKRGYIGHCITRHGSVEEAEKDEVDENIIIKEGKEMDSNWLEMDSEIQETSDELDSKVESDHVEEEPVKITEVKEIEAEDLPVEENLLEKKIIENKNNKNNKLVENSGKNRKKFQTKKERLEDYAKQREKDEKMVADIIAKVKKECEDQSITLCRRGYTRRSTVMTSFKEYDKRKFSRSRFPVQKL